MWKEKYNICLREYNYLLMCLVNLVTHITLKLLHLSKKISDTKHVYFTVKNLKPGSSAYVCMYKNI